MPDEIFISPFKKTVCRDCSERTSHCHTECGRYISEDKEREKLLAKYRHEQKIKTIINEIKPRKFK